LQTIPPDNSALEGGRAEQAAFVRLQIQTIRPKIKVKVACGKRAAWSWAALVGKPSGQASSKAAPLRAPIMQCPPLALRRPAGLRGRGLGWRALFKKLPNLLPGHSVFVIAMQGMQRQVYRSP